MRMDEKAILDVFRTAAQCRICFDTIPSPPPTVDLAEPMWIGPDYARSRPRVVVLMAKPASGENDARIV